MNVVSVNVARPREVEWQGRLITTGIFKTPVTGRVGVRALNLDGDQQADLTVHGGVSKAVYAYPIEHYEFWRRELRGMDLPMGMFGENLTIEGLLEPDAHLGDYLRMGTAELRVTQPRLPCFKLGIKFGRADMVKRFLVSRRTGFYLSVEREGEVGAGDKIDLLHRAPDGVAISDLTRLSVAKKFSATDRDLTLRAIQNEALPESWREHFRGRLARAMR